jgi:hypothetical protein
LSWTTSDVIIAVIAGKHFNQVQLKNLNYFGIEWMIAVIYQNMTYWK